MRDRMNERALKVLEQYELEVGQLRRGRGSYIFDTPQGLRMLCDCTCSEHKAEFQNRVMERMREGGYQRVDRIVQNREGKLVSEDRDGSRYLVREWYVGRECDTASESEILAAVENLARIHQLMQLPDEPELIESFSAPPLTKSLQAQNAELRKIRSFIRRRNQKGSFERLFLQCFPAYYAQAEEALGRLEECGGDGDHPERTGSVCHGDYDHHHVLLCGYEMATTDFSKCRYDCQITDLYRFMRKILEKHDWNQRLGMRMLEQYMRTRPMTAKERRLLYIRMRYPEKFRKLANYYYAGNKAWISGRFLEKLEVLNAQAEKQEAFVRMLER